MLYQTYETRCRLMAPVFGTAGVQAAALGVLPEPLRRLPQIRIGRAWAGTLSALELTHQHPGFGIDTVEIAGEQVAVDQASVAATPFATLVRFSTTAAPEQPRVLVVPGLAGHFGSLIRGTVRTLVADHDVYVADWHNARDVPVTAGRFGLEEYVEHLMDFLGEIGPGAHLVAVCQPCVPALAAASLMAADDDPAQPASIILMAGPVDARINPGPVNRFATRRYSERITESLLTTVPRPHGGHGRRVYPGFVQATGFVNLAPRRHAKAFLGLFRDLALGDAEGAAKTTDFYDEYFAVLDVTAEYYRETARAVFRDFDLARGGMTWRGRQVDPTAITSALLTIEAENDELCPPGQTEVAHDLCTSIPASRRRHWLQRGVGHYGVFSGTRFEQEIYPEIRSFIAAHERVAA